MFTFATRGRSLKDPYSSPFTKESCRGAVSNVVFNFCGNFIIHLESCCMRLGHDEDE